MQRILLIQGEEYILGRQFNVCVPISQSAVKDWLQLRRRTMLENSKGHWFNEQIWVFAY